MNKTDRQKIATALRAAATSLSASPAARVQAARTPDVFSRHDFYRVHAKGENPKTVLDKNRKDGWVADDETPETQPLGISAADTLDDLSSYVHHYSMSIRPGDRLLGLDGKYSPDDDRDRYAVRAIVSSYKDLGPAEDWWAVYRRDIEDIEDLAGEIDEDPDSADDLIRGYASNPAQQAWLMRRLDDERNPYMPKYHEELEARIRKARRGR